MKLSGYVTLSVKAFSLLFKFALIFTQSTGKDMQLDELFVLQGDYQLTLTYLHTNSTYAKIKEDRNSESLKSCLQML